MWKKRCSPKKKILQNYIEKSDLSWQIKHSVGISYGFFEYINIYIYMERSGWIWLKKVIQNFKHITMKYQHKQKKESEYLALNNYVER